MSRSKICQIELALFQLFTLFNMKGKRKNNFPPCDGKIKKIFRIVQFYLNKAQILKN